MTQGICERFWQAEARTQEAKRLVVEGFQGDTLIRDLCRREGIRPSTYLCVVSNIGTTR